MTHKNWQQRGLQPGITPRHRQTEESALSGQRTIRGSSPAETCWGDLPQPMPKTMAVYMSCSSIHSPVLPEPTIHLPWAAQQELGKSEAEPEG